MKEKKRPQHETVIVDWIGCSYFFIWKCPKKRNGKPEELPWRLKFIRQLQKSIFGVDAPVDWPCGWPSTALGCVRFDDHRVRCRHCDEERGCVLQNWWNGFEEVAVTLIQFDLLNTQEIWGCWEGYWLVELS